jgi:DNA-binding NtrC family response regulator
VLSSFLAVTSDRRLYMPKNILIVDDSPEIRKLLRMYFDREIFRFVERQ